MNQLPLIAVLILLSPSARAAEKMVDVKARMPEYGERHVRYPIRPVSTGFRLDILSDYEGVKPESNRNGRPFVSARPGERYSIRLYNPLPVRVAVNLTVDGLNSITGKPSGISNGEKWLIEPYTYASIPGWQVNTGEVRRFFFTEKPQSYAKWRGDWTGKDLAANCGVIGAAFFWNQQELDDYYRTPPPPPIYGPWDRVPMGGGAAQGGISGAWEGDERHEKQSMRRPLPHPYPNRAPQEAGTGMGERESHPTTLVDFHYNAGMYSPDQALLVYYDFGGPEPTPNPFPNLSFAPEMPY